jgi:hypothetical protein
MPEQDISLILQRLSVLETQQKLDWDNHKEQSNLKWAMICKKLDKISLLPCAEHIDTIHKNTHDIKVIKCVSFATASVVLALHVINPDIIQLLLKLL